MMKRLSVFFIFLMAVYANAVTGPVTGGYRIESTENATINAHGVEKIVTNNHASGNAIFVPTNTSTEWSGFRSNLPAGVTIVGTTNKMRDGSVSSLGQGPSSWSHGTISAANDGATSGTWYGRSPDASASNNNNRGLTVTFTSSLALKKVVIWGYNMPYTANVQYWNGSSWVTVAAHTGVKTNPQEISFNADGAISSTQWRWYISGWANASNYYAFEFEAYE